MPSTNRSRSSGRPELPRDSAQLIVEDAAPGRDHQLLHLAEPAADVVGPERHHLRHEAVEEGGVARLVDQLGREEDLRLAAGAAITNGARSAATRSSPM